MSFRDTFTRNSNSSEQLRYDDTAAYHFFVTLLIIAVIPLGWSILRTMLDPFSHIPTLGELERKRQFRDKIQKFKKDNKYSYLTFKFVLKVQAHLPRSSFFFLCSTLLSSAVAPSLAQLRTLRASIPTKFYKLIPVPQ